MTRILILYLSVPVSGSDLDSPGGVCFGGFRPVEAEGARPALVGALSCEHGIGGAYENPEIEEDRSIADILAVERHLTNEVDFGASSNLPQAGDGPGYQQTNVLASG